MQRRRDEKHFIYHTHTHVHARKKRKKTNLLMSSMCKGPHVHARKKREKNKFADVIHVQRLSKF
jgi:hypothetical protein